MNFDPMTFNAMLNMMNQLYPNMGYNMNNFNMYNNQFLTNLMMSWMLMNPSLIQTYNNFNHNNNINMNQFNIFQNRNGMNSVSVSQAELEQAKVTGGGVIPRNLRDINYDASSPYDNFSTKTNIFFTTQKGHKMNITCPLNMKVKDLFIKYVTRLGLGPSIMGNSFYFLFNGHRLSHNEEKTVQEAGIAGSHIIVIDVRGVIGS